MEAACAGQQAENLLAAPEIVIESSKRPMVVMRTRPSGKSRFLTRNQNPDQVVRILLDIPPPRGMLIAKGNVSSRRSTTPGRCRD